MSLRYEPASEPLHISVKYKMVQRNTRGISSTRSNNYFTEMWSGSEAGSYSRLIDFVHHSTLGLRVIKKKRRSHDVLTLAREPTFNSFRHPYHAREQKVADRFQTVTCDGADFSKQLPCTEN